ncbi:MAG: hypothetical protein B6226_00655 [Candidatus Cloacimonetes bacterium 4572_65]|nr:MAG: hypothetical protein B6226_00655 [Candidatus Cloacimonetes bacterium 4572_65]
MKWRVLISGKLSPAENMAIDDAIFQLVQEGKSAPLIRFYDWEPATASLGYHQEAKKEVDFDLLEEHGYGFVRRATGGRLVLHKNEVTYSIISPIDDHLSGNVLKSYGDISFALAEGLKCLGIDVEFEQKELSSISQREAVNPCFSSSSKYELAVNGKKIVGSAQVRKGDVLLQHGSIILTENQREIAYIMPAISDKLRERLANLMDKKTIAINEVLQEKVTFEQAVSAFKKGFKICWDSDVFIDIDELEKPEKELVEKLVKEKYLTDEWNFRK